MKDDNKDKPAGNIPKEDPSKAMDSKKEVEQSPDEKTDQDFPGYPHYPAKEDIMDQRTDAHRVDVDVENLPSSRNASGVSQRFIVSDDREYLKEDTVSQTGMEDDFQDIGPRTVVDEKDKKLANTGSTNAEIGVPQNVDNDDLADDRDLPGTDLDEEDGITNASNDADVTPEERMVLENMDTYTRGGDDERIQRATLDHTDLDGEELNEESFGELVTGDDLDIPEEVDETTTTAMGQGDEENKYYSLGGDRHENLEEDPSGNF